MAPVTDSGPVAYQRQAKGRHRFPASSQQTMMSSPDYSSTPALRRPSSYLARITSCVIEILFKFGAKFKIAYDNPTEAQQILVEIATRCPCSDVDAESAAGSRRLLCRGGRQ
jgi:hypothetical protein